MSYRVEYKEDKTVKIVEISTVLCFILFTLGFTFSHKFEKVAIVDNSTQIATTIEVEKVEITEQVKKIVKPAVVRIPIAVEDEEEIEEDIELEIETADIAFNSEPPPPPPPPTVVEDEVFDFFAIQEKPEMMEGYSKNVLDYINKNYPPLAKKSGVSGKVIVKFVCSKEGIPTNITITLEKPADMGFGEVAVKAIEQARFKPGMQRDKPVPVRMNQVVNFKTNLR